ncbi:MAG: FG-GAP-like repeat-containing protein [Candidatus Limnocylindrales bacterium]
MLRSYGSASGTVQTVDFTAYVQNVMAWEWPSTWPTSTLRAAAIAVKQYAWYYTMHYRGGTSAGGACYDVKDTTADQIYRPETRSAAASHKDAVAATWPMSIRRTKSGVAGTFILTGYRSGSSTACGADADGFLLYGKSLYDCGKKGKTLEEIERIYYGSTLQPTTPGAHQIADTPFGDAGAVVPAASGVDAYVRTSTGAAFAATLSPTHVAIDDGATLGRVSADVNGDGRDELVILVNDGATAQHVAVLTPNGSGYAAPVTWWDSKIAGTSFPSLIAGAPAIQLLAGDFDGDGTTDIALVVLGTDPTTATIYRLRSTKSGFEALVPLYTGALNPTLSRFYAADTTGDGRADVVVETDLGVLGLSYQVLPSGPTGLLGAPLPWYSAVDLLRTTTQTIVTDFDRDGRDDLVLAVKTATGFALLGLPAGASAPVTLAASTVAYERIKVGAGDFDGDGRGDVLVYTRLDGTTGTRLTVYASTGSLFTAANWLDDTKLTWATLEPY